MVGAIIMSLVLYLVTPVVVVWCVGLGVYVLVRRLMKQMKAAAAAAAAVSGGGQEEKKGNGKRIEEEEEEEEGGEEGKEEAAAVYKVLEVDWKNWMGDPRKSFIPNVLARTPDALDVLHRQIARRRVHDEKGGEKWSGIDNDDDGGASRGHRKVE